MSVQSNKMIRVLVFDAKAFDQESVKRAISAQVLNIKLHVDYTDRSLSEDSAEDARGYKVVCIFVNCNANAAVIDRLANLGVELIALRCAGFNNVDLKQASLRNIRVVRVPAYSPQGVAEYSIGMLLSLNRKIHLSNLRTKSQNFAIDGFVGFDLHGKTVSVIGTGKIGKCVISILVGMGCNVVAFDVFEDKDESDRLGFKYVSLEDAISTAKVIFLFAPLTETSFHLINADTIRKMTDKVFLVNCSRGALIDTDALFNGLVSGKIGGAALDVYENEKNYFFRDLRNRTIDDKLLMNLIRHQNVLITSHQAFLTNEALDNIAQITIQNILDFYNKTNSNDDTIQNEIKF